MRCEAGHDLPRSRSYRGSLDLQTFIVGSSLIYSQVAAPLTSLLKRKTHSISWAPEAEHAFHQLKSAFCTALETAETLFQHVFRNFGLPEDIISDRGSQFTSRVWRAFFRLLGVSVSLSSGYHPQTNGQTERKIQEIGRYLRAYCHNHQNSWNQYLPWAEYAQNSLRQSTTGLTPFQCVLGFQPPLFPWTGERSEVPVVDYWFRESERIWDSAHVHLQQAVRRQVLR